MLALAVLACFFRIATRVRLRRKLHLDDYLLLIGVVALIASVAVTLWGIECLYIVEVFTVDTKLAAGVLSAGQNGGQRLIDAVDRFERVVWSAIPLTATTVFMVKFGFLSFFRPLVDHMPRLHQYWRFVVVFTGICYIFSFIDPYVACPKLGGLKPSKLGLLTIMPEC